MAVIYVNGIPAFLPMDPYEAEQFLYDHGLDVPGAVHDMKRADDLYGDHIDWGSDFRMANRLAQRISDLGDLRDRFKAWCDTQENCSVEDALRASYHLNDMEFHPGFDSDELLGEHALDNALLEEYNDLPDQIYDMLDLAKVGAQYREMTGGVFAGGGFLIPEDLSDAQLPPEEPLRWIEVRFHSDDQESGWHEVPKSAHDEGVIANLLECDSLDGLHMDCRSLIPRLNGIASEAEELPRLRDLQSALNDMSEDEIQQYKALLEMIQPDTASAALQLANEMGYYEVETNYADPADYGRGIAEAGYDLAPDMPIFKHIDFASLGAELLESDGYVSTRYGAVYRNAMAQKFLSGPDTLSQCVPFCEGDEGFAADVCWDPDVQKVWLEPNEDGARFQDACNHWGVRHCATQEEYEQVIGEMNAQVMVEEQTQDFGDMTMQ